MQEKRFKSLIEYVLFITVLQKIKILPYGINKAVLTRIFLFAGLVLGIRKKIVIRQLQDSFPDYDKKRIRNIMRALYKNLALTSLEMFTERGIDDIEVEGWENIINALKLKRGLIIVSGHIGNWELAGRYIAKQDLPINGVIKRLRNRYFNNYVNKTREKVGMKIIYKSKTMRPVLSALKNNEIVVTLIDQDAGKDGVVMPFLNREASVFTGFARLAEHYDTPMLLGVALRKEDGKNRFVFDRHILPSAFKDNEDRTLKLVSIFNRKLEEYIKQYPEQWFWVHRRWKGAHKGRRPATI